MSAPAIGRCGAASSSRRTSSASRGVAAGVESHPGADPANSTPWRARADSARFNRFPCGGGGGRRWKNHRAILGVLQPWGAPSPRHSRDRAMIGYVNRAWAAFSAAVAAMGKSGLTKGDVATAIMVAGSPGRRVAGSPGRRVAGSPGRRVAGSPGRRVAGSPGRRVAGSPGRRVAGSPGRRVAGSPGRRVAGSPGRRVAGSPGRRVAGSPGRRVAGSPGRRVAGSPGRRVAGSPNLRPGVDGGRVRRMAALAPVSSIPV